VTLTKGEWESLGPDSRAAFVSARQRMNVEDAALQVRLS